MKTSKRGFRGFRGFGSLECLALIAIVIAISAVIVSLVLPNALAQAREELKSELESELNNLTQQLIGMGYDPDAIFDADHIFVENYSCSRTGYETSSPITAGKHNLEFDFGGQKAYARNLVVEINLTINYLKEDVIREDNSSTVGENTINLTVEAADNLTAVLASKSIGTTTPVSPANGFIVDRDSVNASAADSVSLVASINENTPGVTVTFKANLTMPGIASEVNIVLGNAVSNSTGHANITWYGNDSNNEKMYAGNYTWWAEADNYPSNETRFIYLYQGLNLSYRYADKHPNATYTLGDIAYFEMLLDSPGPETRTQLNSTYLAKVNSTLTDPTGTNHSVELLDPGEDEPLVRIYNALADLAEDPVPLNPLENLAQDTVLFNPLETQAQEQVPSSASPTKTPTIPELFEFVKSIIRKIIQLKSK